MHRYTLRDDQWEKIKDFLPGREGHVGGTAADNRLFVDAVIYRYRAGSTLEPRGPTAGTGASSAPLGGRCSLSAKPGVLAAVSGGGCTGLPDLVLPRGRFAAG